MKYTIPIMLLIMTIMAAMLLEEGNCETEDNRPGPPRNNKKPVVRRRGSSTSSTADSVSDNNSPGRSGRRGNGASKKMNGFANPGSPTAGHKSQGQRNGSKNIPFSPNGKRGPGGPNSRRGSAPPSGRNGKVGQNKRDSTTTTPSPGPAGNIGAVPTETSVNKNIGVASENGNDIAARPGIAESNVVDSGMSTGVAR